MKKLSKILATTFVLAMTTACSANNVSGAVNQIKSNSVSNGSNLANVSNTASGKLIPVTVAKNTDGDTIHIRLNDGQGPVKTVRMLLIDSAEDVKPNNPVEPYGLDAANYAKKVLPVGKHIYIEEGKPGYTSDKYGRLLAYIYITPNDMYNLDLVKKGLARVAYIYPPNTQHLNELEQAQNVAKSHKLGIWSINNYVTPKGYNLSIACQWAAKNHYSTKGCY